MQQGIERHDRTHDDGPGLRVGLSAGEVTKEADDYFGDAVTEAAHLADAAGGGQILASDVVRAMAGRRSPHRYGALGALDLKGLPALETVEVLWEPLAGAALTGVPLPARLTRPPAVGVVGRAVELETMADAVKRVASGEGREVLLVSGEAGRAERARYRRTRHRCPGHVHPKTTGVAVPLDPQARTLLDQIDALDGPPMWQQTAEEARASFALLTAITGPVEDPVPTEDRDVPGPAGDFPVRIYRPDSDQPLPVVVYFHGGGFVIGDIATHDSTCQRLASGVPALVVSVDYRLAPEHRFPAAVDDCDAATRWVSDHAVEMGGDPARLAVAGDSAGGNLAAVVALHARDAGGPPVAFQLLVYPATDMTRALPSHTENGKGYLLDSDTMAWFLDNYLADADPRHPDASPLFAHDLSGLPPALVVTAEFDPLRDEGEAYAARLRQAGVAVTTSRYDGMIHGFYGLDSIFDTAKRATADTVATLREALT
jgi:acetyl esterase